MQRSVQTAERSSCILVDRQTQFAFYRREREQQCSAVMQRFKSIPDNVLAAVATALVICAKMSTHVRCQVLYD